MNKWNDKARRIVKLGIGRGPKDTFRPDMYDLGAYTPRVEAEAFCNDWRVVGALMEKVYASGDNNWYHFSNMMLDWNHYEDAQFSKGMADPEAIVDACLLALEGK